MFRTIGDEPAAWELLLPPEVLRLPQELARVDALLEDPVFFVPFAPRFDPLIGRPCTPIGCYLRLMFLKFRCRWAMRACAPSGRLDLVAAVLPHPAQRQGPAPGHADEADHPLR